MKYRKKPVEMTREEAIEDIEKNIKPIVGGKSLDMAIEALSVRYGQWFEKEIVNESSDVIIGQWQVARCSVCRKDHTTPYMYFFTHFAYCPNCGAKMERTE